MILDSSPADSLATEVLGAFDGRALLLVIALVILAVWGLTRTAPTVDDLLADHDAAESWRAEWRDANDGGADSPWGRS